MLELVVRSVPRTVLGLSAALLVAAGCSGASEHAPTGGTQTAGPATQGAGPATLLPATTTAAVTPPPAGLVLGNEPPSFEIPAWTKVGVGQEIGFGLEVIDEESDEIRVELIDKPASATYDPYTLTVVWKPTAKDIPAGNFTVRITEIQPETKRQRVYTHRFGIEVTRQKQPAPRAQPLGPVVETLITIHDPERLAALDKAWPIDRMLGISAGHAYAALSDEEKKAVPPPDAKTLYESFLIAFAEANDNPTIDPRSPKFDKKAYGNPRDWKIITLRPRLDKAWNEIRIVYKPVNSHDIPYAMFRFKPVADTPEAGARTFNNRAFQRLALEAFFTADGRLDPANVTDKKRHAKKVLTFVEGVLNFRSDEHPWARPGVEPLPCESRLGGGSKRDASGNYESGDGWSWHVQAPRLIDGKIRYTNVPIKGFATAVKPAADGKSYQMACAPRFDPHDGGHAPGYETLCLESGHVFMPGSGDGYQDEIPGQPPVRARKDAANLFREHKNKYASEHLALEDPRRDLFEENGMTCHQCHVRKFGVHDRYDASAWDPSAGLPEMRNKKQAPTYFVIVPTQRWQPYAIDFQHKQECKFKDAFERDSGVKTDLGCPLRAEQ